MRLLGIVVVEGLWENDRVGGMVVEVVRDVGEGDLAEA